ncbi:hypothetical protein DXG01_012916 [Tephrocybe rancida]|nr:hypothetical protein DXG01_012916 [Tephrocybe rancida]
MPVNTSIFHGRDSIVAKLSSIITGPSPQHVCLLGPGGMGKTSTALAVMEHADVRAYFTDQLVWVPCVKAASLSIFLDTLHTSLGITTKSVNPLNDILSHLEGLSVPIVLLLDNFETPWNTDESEAEGVLRRLRKSSHVTLFITMRSSTPPCTDLPWVHVNLRAVDAAAALEIYVEYQQNSRDDPALPRLLALIGHMPLAIKLLARLSSVTGLSAEQLIEEYNKEGTQMLGQGLDAETSMDICLSLSVYSSRMKAHPNAFTLLCMLSMLPVGTSYQTLSRWWAKDLPNLAGMLDVLKSTSLVEATGTTFFVLPVIQRYIRHPSRFLDKVRACMIGSACSFLKEHSPNNYLKSKSIMESLSSESNNLEAVLLTATADPRIIRHGLLLLARYQSRCQPRLDVIEHSLKLAKDIDDKILQADIYFYHGKILSVLRHYRRALHAYTQAHILYQSMSDRRSSVHCRLALAVMMRQTRMESFAVQVENILAAQADCEWIGDDGLSARCLAERGVLYALCGRPVPALQLLMQAEPILALDGPYFHPACSLQISRVYMSIEDYDSAHQWATSAFKELANRGATMDYASAACELGRLYHRFGKYEESIRHMRQCQETYASLGQPLPGFCLLIMGLALVGAERITDGRRVLGRMLRMLPSEEGLSDYIICWQFILHRADNQMIEPTSEEMAALRRRYPGPTINTILSPSFSIHSLPTLFRHVY